MPKGGGIFSPMARQQQALLSPAPSRSSAASSSSMVGGRRDGMLLIAEQAERRVQAERELRRQIAVEHRQQLRAQISHREAATRAEQQRSHAAERAAIPAAGRPWDSRFERKQVEPVPWAQHIDQGPGPRRGADLKRVLVGEGELVDGEDAVWDTAQGIWRKGGSPHGSRRGSNGGFDAIVEAPEGWTMADQKRLADERAARAAKMESKWDDGMSNISEALSELLDSLTFESVEQDTNRAVEPEREGSKMSKAMPVVLVSREGLHSKGKKVMPDARGNTHGLLYHRDAQCPVPAPVEKHIAVYAKLIKGGGVVTRGTASFMGVKQVSGKVNDHEHVIQPIRISGPDNRVLPKGYSGGRRSGSAGLPPPPPKKPPLPSVRIKKPKKNTPSVGDPGVSEKLRKTRPSVPKQVGVSSKKRADDEVTPEESGVDADATACVTPAQMAQLAAMTVVDIGAHDSSNESDDSTSQPTPVGSSDEDIVEEPSGEEEDPAAKASRLHAENLQQKQGQQEHQEEQSSRKSDDSPRDSQQLQAENSAVGEDALSTRTGTSKDVDSGQASALSERGSQRQVTGQQKPGAASEVASKSVGDDPVFAQLMSMVTDSNIPGASSSSEDEERDEYTVEAEADIPVRLPEAVPPSAAQKPTKPPRPSKSPATAASRTGADESISISTPTSQVVEQEYQQQHNNSEDGAKPDLEEENVEEEEEVQKVEDERATVDSGLTVEENVEKQEVVQESEEEEDAVAGGLTVEVPEGTTGGEIITIALEDGREMDIEIPEGLVAGDEFTITIDEGDDLEEQEEQEEEKEEKEEQEEQEQEQEQTIDEEEEFIEELTASLSPSRRMTMGDTYEHKSQSAVDNDEESSDDSLVSDSDASEQEDKIEEEAEKQEVVQESEEEEDAVAGGLTVEVPEGTTGGETITIALEDGREMDIEIPEGLVAGDEFTITIDEGDDLEEQEEQEQGREQHDDGDTSQGEFVELTIVCPLGSLPGDTISIETDSGEVEVVVPEGVDEGQEFEVRVSLDAATQPSSDAEEPARAAAAELAQSTDEFGDLASIMAAVDVSSDDDSSSSASSGDVDLEALLGKTTGKATPEVIAAEVGAPAIVAEQQET